MNYPVMINLDDLNNYGIAIETGENADRKNAKFLRNVHRLFYEFIVLTSHRSLRLRLIEKYREDLEPQIKEILLNIAEAINESGDYNALNNGRTVKTDGSTETVDIQSALAVSVPPETWQAIFSLEPNIIWAGGEI